MQRTGSAGLKNKKQKSNRTLRSNSNLDDSTSCFERFCDYLITGDFSGLYYSAKNGTRHFITDSMERWQNFQNWFAKRKKEHELRAMDVSLEHPYPRIRHLVNSQAFEAVGNLVIFGNTFVVAIQAEQMPWAITPEEESMNLILENVFTLAFVIELSLSTLCWGWTYILCRENFMDVFLVFLGVLTTWILAPFGITVEFLRKLTALRTLRLIRLARSVRLRPEFKEMWALVSGLADSGETLFWTYVMIACVCYFFAIIATAMIGKAENFKEDEIAQEYFGDVTRSMLTFFQLMTLDSWTGAFARPLMEKEIWIGPFLIFFIAVAVFVLLNLITAVIVENAFSDSKSEEKELALRLEREKEEELEDLKQFFLQIDLDGSGSLTKQEFFKATKQRKIRNKLRALDIMPKDIDDLWDILDDGEGELQVDSFQSGIRRLRGEAKSKDILRLSKELRQFEMSVDEVENFIEVSKQRLRSIQDQLSRCRVDIAAFTRTLVRAKEAVKMATQTQSMS